MYCLYSVNNCDAGNPVDSVSVRFFLLQKNARAALVKATENILKEYAGMTEDDEHQVCVSPDYVRICDGMDSYLWQICPAEPEDGKFPTE